MVQIIVRHSVILFWPWRISKCKFQLLLTCKGRDIGKTIKKALVWSICHLPNMVVFDGLVPCNETVHLVKFETFDDKRQRYSMNNLKIALKWCVHGPKMVLILKYTIDMSPGNNWPLSQIWNTTTSRTKVINSLVDIQKWP